MTLNEKIVDIFRTSYYEDTDGRWFSEEKAATEIEKLVIQEQLGLLKNLRGLNAGGTEVNLQWKILELSDKLNELKSK